MPAKQHAPTARPHPTTASRQGQSLTPLERAALLLREVFGFGYDEIARILGRSEEACRQLVSRGRKRLGDPRPRFEADPGRRRELTEQFLAAVGTGDLAGLLELLRRHPTGWCAARRAHRSRKSSRH